MKIEKKRYQIEDQYSFVICHMSDLHFSKGYPPYLFDTLIKELENERLDYICLTGDLIDDASYIQDEKMALFYAFMEKLGKIASVICIIGNHDETKHKRWKETYVRADELKEKLRTIENIIVLENTIYEEENIRFIGYEQSTSLFKKETSNVQKVVEEINTKFKRPYKKDKINIFLLHSPLCIGKIRSREKIKVLKTVSVILAGHTHNGLVPSFLEPYFPKNRGLISPNKKMLPKLARGKIEGKPYIIINGAIIKLSRTSGLFRFFRGIFPSSITFIEIGSKKKNIDRKSLKKLAIPLEK